ncbi:Uncharacterized protein BM_BM7614 [Brugia malayi]|uniref:Bm7614 n=3 Tax=Brugia TaxID=6278 RepID=A0A0K0JT39_BRUMA|nr:Uncharacterized protein BM_BM7614 [Brugia malayi]CTP81142.1 Bm7614 [Brugia malayi]VIO90227.1 Uncharacterized protein BM_BM7614 [Brugia malayi]
MNYFIKRSKSLDLNLIPRESYLGRWSRETTPRDSQQRYERNIRRSYTPAREIGSFKVIEDDRLPRTPHRARTSLGIITTPYHTNINYYQEQLPIRKYDIFSVRTWAYPIYKYLHSRDLAPTRPYSFTRIYGNTSTYTPPMLAAETRRLTQRRNYTGYTYIGAEHSYDIASRPNSLDNYHFWRSHIPSSSLYTSYYGNSGLRHYNSYRPRTFISRLSRYWAPYF